MLANILPISFNNACKYFPKFFQHCLQIFSQFLLTMHANIYFFFPTSFIVACNYFFNFSSTLHTVIILISQATFSALLLYSHSGTLQRRHPLQRWPRCRHAVTSRRIITRSVHYVGHYPFSQIP